MGLDLKRLRQALTIDPRYPLPAAGYSYTPLLRYKTADQSVSSLTLADDTHLTAPIVASGKYFVEIFYFFIAAATATGPAVSLNGPASPTSVKYSILTPTVYGAAGAAATMAANGATAYNTILLGANTPSTTLPGVLQLYGFIENGATAGNLVGRIAGEAAASITYQKGSFMRLTRVA